MRLVLEEPALLLEPSRVAGQAPVGPDDPVARHQNGHANGKPHKNGHAPGLNGHAHNGTNGHARNGVNGHANGHVHRNGVYAPTLPVGGSR